MKVDKTLFVLIVIALIAAACASSSKTEPTASLPQTTIVAKQPTDTLPPSPTSTATTIQTSTNTASITPTPSQTATAIPYYTQAALFPVYTQHAPFLDTPAPIPVPISNIDNYQLADWTESEAIDLIHEADNYIYSRDFPGLSGNRFTFQDDQIYAELAAKEALLFYPNSKYKQELLWKLANIHAVQNETTSDEWIVSTLEEGLINHDYSPSSIGDVLAEHGFEIDESYQIPNLFGDGKTIDVLIINTQHIFTSDGILVAIHETSPGTYNLILMDSMWDFHHGSLKIIDFQDFNENGIPEVFAGLEILATSSDSCHIDILEWDGAEFIKLTENKKSISAGGGCPYSYTPALKQLKIKGSRYSSTTKYYNWDGEIYGLDSIDYDYFGDQIYDAFSDYEYDQLIFELENYLAGNSTFKYLSSWNKDLDSPTSKDFLTFILGLAYIYNGETIQGIQVLQELADSPHSTKYPYISQAADAYVTTLDQTKNSFYACQSAMEVIQAVPGYHDSQLGTNFEAIGLPQDYHVDIEAYCYYYAPTQIIEKILNDENNSNLPEILDQLEIQAEFLTSFDFWGDGQESWVFSVDFYGNEKPDTFMAIWYQGQWSLREIPTPKNPDTNFELSLIYFPNFELPMIAIKDDEDQYLLSISEQDNSIEFQYTIDAWGDEFALGKIENKEYPVAFTYAFTNYIYEPDSEYSEAYFSWEFYYWDETQEEFIKGTFAEQLIFEEGRYQEAIQLLQTEIAALKPYYQKAKAFSQNIDEYDDFGENLSKARARLLYLLGLAYQLNGNDNLALERYYQVWQEHPDTGYAIMARGKLAPN